MSTEEVISFDHTIFDDPEKFEYTPAFTVTHLIKLSADTIPIDRLKHMYLIMHNDQTNRRLAYTICDDLFSNIDIAKTRVLIRIIKSVLRNNNNDSNNNGGMQQNTSSSSSSGRDRSSCLIQFSPNLAFFFQHVYLLLFRP